METSKEATAEKTKKEEVIGQVKECEEKISTLETEVKDMTMAHDGLIEKLNFLNQVFTQIVCPFSLE